jgi:hypothetical protein
MSKRVLLLEPYYSIAEVITSLLDDLEYEVEISGLPSFLVTSQIGHGQLCLNGSVSLLSARVHVLHLHHTMPRTASIHLPFRFDIAKLIH